MKLLELFAGYGGASFALKKLGINFEVVGYSEIDKYAIQCYEQNHKGKNLGDITLINEKELPDFNLLTGGFPCQSFSIAGKRLGIEDKRGQLFWDIIRIVREKQPSYILLENVKGLTTGKNKEIFAQMISDLEDVNYKVYWKVLNTKHYGIPQNRERVYIVGIRKDIKQDFEFPEPIELKIFLKDILEDNPSSKFNLTKSNIKTINRNFGAKGKVLDLTNDFSLIEKMTYPSRIHQKKGEKVSPTLTTAMGTGGGNVPVIINKVDEKYYLTEAQLEKVLNSTYNSRRALYQGDKKICSTLAAREYKEPKIVQVNNPKHSNNRVYSSKGGNRQPFIVASRGRYDKNGKARQQLEPRLDGASNSITTVQKDNYIAIRNATKKGYLKAMVGDGINLEQPNSNQTNDQRAVVTEDFRIRKLTPKECFRLMGFLQDKINLEGLSNTQQYKLAGNGWTLSPVKEILNNIIKNETL